MLVFPFRLVIVLVMLAVILLMELVHQSVNIIGRFRLGKSLTNRKDVVEMFKWTVGK